MPDTGSVFLDNGELIKLDGNSPVIIGDKESMWIVTSGKVDLFSVKISKTMGRAIGKRYYLFSVNTGSAIFGLDFEKYGKGMGIIAVGLYGTNLIKIKKQKIKELSRNPEYIKVISGLVDSWIGSVSPFLTFEGKLSKKSTHLISNQKNSNKKGFSATSIGKVRWIQIVSGESIYCDRRELVLRKSGAYIPVTQNTWITAIKDTELNVIETESFVWHTDFIKIIDEYNKLILKWMIIDRRKKILAEKKQFYEKLDGDFNYLNKSYKKLLSAIETTEDESEEEVEEAGSLYSACKLIAEFLGAAMPDNAAAKNVEIGQNIIKDISKASNLRARKIILKGKWWKNDNGPILAFSERDDRIIAIIPESPMRYAAYDVYTHSMKTVSEENAKDFKAVAYMLYRPLPEKIKTMLDLVKFGVETSWKKDFVTIILSAFAIGILGLVIPMATGLIFGSVLPQAEESILFQLSLVLIMNAFASFLFEITRAVAILRVENRMNSSIQASIWDRLLNLPAPFFKRYTSGDLAMRANGINAIRMALSGATIATMLSGLFAVLNLGVLFAFDAMFAFVGIGLVAVSVSVTIGLTLRKMSVYRKITSTEGKITGLMLQIISGVAKLRVAGAENRALFLWAKYFANKKKVTLGARNTENFLKVFNTIYPIISTAVIFYLIINSEGKAMSTGGFLAFNVAFSNFLAGSASLTMTMMSVIQVIPLYERVRPIIEEPLEVDKEKEEAGIMTGDIEVSGITFKYGESGPIILKDVSIKAAKGEFIAIVGPSGSGKSTLFRMLLGFEKPTAGKIYYDGKELENLDLRSVRKQLGVVLQNGKLIEGDILSNIAGSTSISMEDAADACKMVGIYDDIMKMPMKMHTLLNEGAKTLSGGQRQRLLIARAIVSKPKILYFDEATSALDNKTQALVSESLEKLKSTRVVIAHRLSTIKNADRIYVLEKGRVVQFGNYEELIKKEGPFADLARRQML